MSWGQSNGMWYVLSRNAAIPSLRTTLVEHPLWSEMSSSGWDTHRPKS